MHRLYDSEGLAISSHSFSFLALPHFLTEPHCRFIACSTMLGIYKIWRCTWSYLSPILNELTSIAAYTLLEKRNMWVFIFAALKTLALTPFGSAFYIGGIMCYKFGIEFFNGSIIALAADRFNAAHAYTKRRSSLRIRHVVSCSSISSVGAATGLNQAAQCVGAILIAPLIKSWPTRTVLAFSIFTFALMTTLLLIVDAGTGTVLFSTIISLYLIVT